MTNVVGKKKPILIDALHICVGGGLMILNHLVNNLVARDINFVLLKDCRCPKLESEGFIENLITLDSSFNARRKYYKEHRLDFHSVLSFGNIPPYVKMPVPVHTYFHNVSLLKIPADYGLKRKCLSYLKKKVLQHYAKYTTDWIVQTTNTANLVNDVLARGDQDVKQFPFYNLPHQLTERHDEVRTDYVFIGDYTHAKGHEYLVEAWAKLHRMGINPTLHLTVSDPVQCRWIEAAIAEGTKIVNHGKIPFEEVIKLYHKSKATVYPSLNESLGLGIIEAMAAQCDVIGCDLPYIYSVCIPSATFAPRNSNAIVDAVIHYEKGLCPKTEPLIRDMINEFIDFLDKQ